MLGRIHIPTGARATSTADTEAMGKPGTEAMGRPSTEGMGRAELLETVLQKHASFEENSMSSYSQQHQPILSNSVVKECQITTLTNEEMVRTKKKGDSGGVWAALLMCKVVVI